MTEKEIYKNGVALLEEWEDVNYCEHSFKFKDEWITDKEVVDLLKQLNDENEQLIKDNFELQGLLGDVRALLRLDKVDDAISRIDKFERSMKK